MKFLKLKRILFSSSIIILIFFSSFFISCSSHSIGEFQNNAAEPPYRLFNILDDYPAVLSAFKNLDQAEFNRKMAEAVNADIDAAKDIFPLMGELSNDGTHHSKDLIDDIRHLVDLIRSQDTSDLDLPPVSTNYTDNSTAYLTDFYSFLDGIGNARTGVSGDLVPIVGKMTSYLTTRPDIETEVTDLIASLRESDSGSDGQSLSYLLKLLQEPLKKMLITTNENIWLNGTTVVADRASIDTGAHTNTGLGNAVRGLDALLSGLNDILSGDAEARNDLYAVITEFGAALDPAKGDTADMLKSLICEIEDRFTVGGAKFNGDYYTNDDDTYVNAELGNALKELWPPLQQLIIRSDTLTANGFKSIGYDAEGRSPLQVFVEALGKLDVDLSSYEIDDTLFKMVWYDGKGRPRFDHGGVSADPAASNISYLEQVLYTMVCAASFGYKDGGVTEEEYYNHNSTTGEVTAVNNGNYGNASHGHGEPTGGYLTLNDTMFNMTVPKLLEGMDIYGSYLDYNSSSYSYVNQVGQYVYRGKEGFTYDESLAAGTNGPADRFFLNSNYPANLMLSGLCVGDAGIPNGGRNLITAQKYNDEEVVYWPADSAGIGELNTARWMIGWIARAVWAGEGPYYHAASNAETAVIQGKTFYKYLRPNGAVYAYVHKPDPSDAATWEYIYPSDGAGDDQNPVAELVVRPTCAEFAGTRDFTNDISLSAGDDWTFRIKLGNSVDTTVTFSGGDTVSRSELIDAINSAVGSTVCFENDDYDHDGDGDLVSSTSRIQSILIRSTIGPILLESLGDRNALRELITDGGNLWTGTIPVYSAPAKGAIRQDKTFSTVSQPAVFNLKVDNSIDVDITIPAGDYSGDDIIAACVGQEASLAPYLIANGNGFKIRGSSNDIGSAKLIITAISGDGLAEIFGVSGSSIIRYLGRGNRYKESWHTDFYMSKVNHGNYTPEQWSRADETDSGSKEAGCVWYAEKLPEYSATRECATQEETLYRNFQWVLNEKKLVYVIPVVTLSPKIVMFLKIEGNGVRGLASAKKLKKPEDYAGDYDANNCWSIKKNGSDLYDGESFEPGDSRIDCYIPHYVNENINEQAVYTGIVGENYLLPDVVGANIAP
ncbi:MAG: hypothetical protein GY754_40570, partial [bacterium]|nr:hypothetical protein [bacterium]